MAPSSQELEPPQNPGRFKSSTLLASFWGWLQAWGVGDVTAVLAPLTVVLVVTPVLVMMALLLVALLMTPALVTLVAERRFPHLERKQGGSFWASAGWSVGSTLLALVALVVSVPLWLVPPLVLVCCRRLKTDPLRGHVPLQN